MTEPVISHYYSGEILTKSWYLNGERHRIDGPARIVYTPSGETRVEYWYLNGEKHRTDGPAEIFYNNPREIIDTSWYLNGDEIYPEEWLKENGYKWPLTEDQQTDLLLTFR